MGEQELLHSDILPGSYTQGLQTIHLGRRLGSSLVKKRTLLVRDVCNGGRYACQGIGYPVPVPEMRNLCGFLLILSKT